MFANWAMPVTHPAWAVVALVSHRVMRLSGYRILGGLSHYAWRRAVAEEN